MMDYEQWLGELKRTLEKRTGRSDMEVTGGPYRGYDVRVSHKGCHPLVDFYSAMRWDPARVRAALDYAVSMVKDWEATLAAREKEMQVVRPHFELLQTMFPDLELHYTVQYGETHFVRAEKERSKIIVSFDLWPAMKEKDIERLVEYIREYAAEMAKASDSALAGADYW
jgi:hypothetical protein